MESIPYSNGNRSTGFEDYVDKNSEATLGFCVKECHSYMAVPSVVAGMPGNAHPALEPGLGLRSPGCKPSASQAQAL